MRMTEAANRARGLVPVDGNASSRRSETYAPLSFTLEPFESPLVVLEEGRELLVASLVVVLQKVRKMSQKCGE